MDRRLLTIQVLLGAFGIFGVAGVAAGAPTLAMEQLH